MSNKTSASGSQHQGGTPMAGASRGTGSQSDDGLDDAVVVRSTRIVWCVALMLLAFDTWAYLFEIDEVSTGTGKVIPSSREQVI